MTRKTPTVRIALIAVTAAALFLVPAALADKGGGGKGGNKSAPATGAFTLVLLNSTDGLPHYGQDVTFDVTSTSAYPAVQLTCYQNGDWVKNQYVGFYSGYLPPHIFSLKSWIWPGGAADCTARLFDAITDDTLATWSFHVYE